MSEEALQERFARLVDALGPWLPHVVIAGGWAHRLHRLHALADRPDYVPLMTKDIDVAVGAAELPVEGSLRERLLAANFTEEMTGECRPPITYYHIGSPQDPFYAEFLVPLTGGETKRDGQSDATVRVSGVSAQKLRHLDLVGRALGGRDRQRETASPRLSPRRSVYRTPRATWRRNC